VISNFIMQAIHGENITVYGDGSQTRSFCYIDDLVEGMIRMMDYETGEQARGKDYTMPYLSGFPGPLNLGNPHEVPVVELAQWIVGMVGSASKIIFEKLPDDDRREGALTSQGPTNTSTGSLNAAGRRSAKDDRLFRERPEVVLRFSCFVLNLCFVAHHSTFVSLAFLVRLVRLISLTLTLRCQGLPHMGHCGRRSFMIGNDLPMGDQRVIILVALQ